MGAYLSAPYTTASNMKKALGYRGFRFPLGFLRRHQTLGNPNIFVSWLHHWLVRLRTNGRGEDRWSALEIWAPDREATVALRLAFRPPEGISRLNGIRLNSFIQENQNSIRFSRVRSILAVWGIERWVERNLIDLYNRNRIRITGDRKIVPGIESKLE
jgi:hypothetical protein